MSRADLFAAAADLIEKAARSAIQARGRFLLALSGGSTPRGLYEVLSSPQRRNRIDWARVEVFFGDERCVAPADPQSNFRMAKESLLDPLALSPEQVHRMRGEDPDSDRAAADYEAVMRRFLKDSEAMKLSDGGLAAAEQGSGVLGLDLVLLGIGADCHTASLFPRTPGLRERTRWVVANPGPAGSVPRLTVTPPILREARDVIFLVSGADKVDALPAILDGPLDPETRPAQLLLEAKGAVTWLVDADAAGKIDRQRWSNANPLAPSVGAR